MSSSGLELRDALIGAVIEGTGGVRYHLREIIGEGGQGWVYRANYDDPDGFWVVVKVLRPECVHSDALQRFQREAEVLRRLGAVAAPNPNIVRFYDYGVHPTGARGGEIELPFIALEHVDGQTLAHVIRAHGGFGLPIARVRRVMKQVARALHTVHEQRIVHRDLKPSNIILAQHNGQEVAKVTDFGLVKLPDLTANKTISVAGASLGYAPPEQYEAGNNRVSAATDVFSFASVLYEILCGTEAFPLKARDSPLRVVARMLSGDRPSLARVSATVPRELRDRQDLTAALDREIARALSADPAVRHGTIKEMWERVEPILFEAAHRGATNVSEEPSTFDSNQPALPLAVAAPMPEWRITGRPLTSERLRAAVIAHDGHSIIALGVHGLYYFARGAWSAMQVPPGVEPRSLKGAIRTPKRDVVLFGEGGLALTLARSGGVERIDLGDRDLVLLGAHADDDGVVFVGERASRQAGVIVEVPRGGKPVVRTLEGVTRLHAVARLTSGAMIACGTHGALLLINGEDERSIPWGRTGHLYAIAAADDGGAFTVGSGGHALRISPPSTLPGLVAPPAATLEAVQTTRDLVSLALDDEGAPWAVGGAARLMHRRSAVWTRIPLEPTVSGQLVAVRPRREGITVLADDGTVLEGPGTDAV